MYAEVKIVVFMLNNRKNPVARYRLHGQILITSGTWQPVAKEYYAKYF